MTAKELLGRLQELTKEGDCDIDLVIAKGNTTWSYSITSVERDNDGAMDFIGIYSENDA